MNQPTVSITRPLVDDICNILGSLPYAQVAQVFARLAKELETQQSPVPTPPAAS